MGIMRVHYRERQRLNAADMRQEQDYRLGLGGRHDLAHHSWGIVRGLRLVAGADGSFMLTPGVAIDGYGREIVVPLARAVDVAGLDPPGAGYVQLYYCEEAQQPSAGKSCGDQPAPRIGPRPVVVASSFAAPIPAPGDLALARAAGVDGLAAWPVLVATIGAGAAIGYSLTRYAAHHAALIRAPNARALIQLGLLSRMDFYHFLLSTRDATAALDKRIGIDRHGTVHFWRSLSISASKAEARISVARNLQLKITAPMPAGTGRPTIEGAIDARFDTLTVSLRAGALPAEGSDAHAPLVGERAALAFRDGQLGKVELFDAEVREVIRFSKGRRRALRQLGGQAAAFSEQMVPADATLVLKNLPASPVDGASPCDIERTRSSRAEPDLSALLLRPAKAVKAAPLAREVHAIDTSRPGDLVPGTALRITGGAADDSDASDRVSIGIHLDDGYHAAFHMNGGRRIAISALTGKATEPVLKVERTVYLPPIGAKDPLLPELLALAYMGGLRRMGNVTSAVKLTLELVRPDGAPPQGAPLSYHIETRPVQGTAFTVKRTMELITGEDGKGDLTFRALAPPPADIALPDLGQARRKVQLTVLMLVEIAQKTRVVASEPKNIDLDNPFQ